MRKSPRKKSTSPVLTIKTGTVDEFFSKLKKISRAADKNEPLEGSFTLTFEDPTELLHILTTTKLKLINRIRKHPDSITNIAKSVHRNRAAVYRDINALERAGIVKITNVINPGHGHHKIVKVVARKLKLVASI